MTDVTSALTDPAAHAKWAALFGPLGGDWRKMAPLGSEFAAADSDDELLGLLECTEALIELVTSKQCHRHAAIASWHPELITVLFVTNSVVIAPDVATNASALLNMSRDPLCDFKLEFVDIPGSMKRCSLLEVRASLVKLSGEFFIDVPNAPTLAVSNLNREGGVDEDYDVAATAAAAIAAAFKCVAVVRGGAAKDPFVKVVGSIGPDGHLHGYTYHSQRPKCSRGWSTYVVETTMTNLGRLKMSLPRIAGRSLEAYQADLTDAQLTVFANGGAAALFGDMLPWAKHLRHGVAQPPPAKRARLDDIVTETVQPDKLQAMAWAAVLMQVNSQYGNWPRSVLDNLSSHVLFNANEAVAVDVPKAANESASFDALRHVCDAAVGNTPGQTFLNIVRNVAKWIEPTSKTVRYETLPAVGYLIGIPDIIQLINLEVYKQGQTITAVNLDVLTQLAQLKLQAKVPVLTFSQLQPPARNEAPTGPPAKLSFGLVDNVIASVTPIKESSTVTTIAFSTSLVARK